MSAEEAEQARERQHERDMEQLAAQGAMSAPGPSDNAFDAQKAEYLETLIDDDIDTGLVNELDNVLSRDFVLGNLKDADFEEIKWLVRLEIQFVLSNYPLPDSQMHGWYRAAIADDPSEHKNPVPAETRSKIETLSMAFLARVSRSVDAEQLEHFERTTQRVERMDSNDEDDGGLTGLV